MAITTGSLDDVKVAAPCSAAWDEMIGDEQVRFCSQCQLNVYNLSGMTRDEGESLIARTEGRLCVRFYRRADGTILTSNCPVGLRAVRQRLSCVARAVASTTLSFFAGVGIYAGLREKDYPEPSTMMGVMEVTRPEPSLTPPEADEIMGQIREVKGEMATPTLNSRRTNTKAQTKRR